MEQVVAVRRLRNVTVLVALLAVCFVNAPDVLAQAAPAAPAPADNTVTEDDIIAGTMNIDFKTRTNLDTSGDLKEG